MEWELTYDPADGILFIQTRGVLESKAATQLRNESVALLKQHDCKRILLDHSLLEGYALTATEIYDIPKMYDAFEISRAVRMGLVIAPSLIDKLRFYETVCRNNGYSVMLFPDRESALAWLKK